MEHKKETGHTNTDTLTDEKLNYCKNSLHLCYLAKDFLDARKRGDGERLCRLYKNFLLFFKLDGRTKYSFQSLHLLAELSFLLPPGLAHELKWNRFVNNKGLPDSNVELDRELEHRNKYVKEEIKSFGGNVTDVAINQCSRSYGPLQDLMDVFDKESGHKTSKNWRCFKRRTCSKRFVADHTKNFLEFLKIMPPS